MFYVSVFFSAFLSGVTVQKAAFTCVLCPAVSICRSVVNYHNNTNQGVSISPFQMTTTCCCSGNGLKRVVLTLGIISVILNTLEVIADVIFMHVPDNERFVQKLVELVEKQETHVVDENLQIDFTFIHLLLSFITLIISGLLILGVCNSQPSLLFPALVWLPLELGLHLPTLLLVGWLNVTSTDHQVVVELVVLVVVDLVYWPSALYYWRRGEGGSARIVIC